MTVSVHAIVSASSQPSSLLVFEGMAFHCKKIVFSAAAAGTVSAYSTVTGTPVSSEISAAAWRTASLPFAGIPLRATSSVSPSQAIQRVGASPPPCAGMVEMNEYGCAPPRSV